MKLLVSISNYGPGQLKYLQTVIDEFRSYKNYDVTINVHTTVPIGRTDINEFLYDPEKVGRMSYLHRQEFFNNRGNYDLFLFVENDILIKEEAVDVYMKYNAKLPINYCLGFLSYEQRPTDDPADKNLYLMNLWPSVEHSPQQIRTTNMVAGPSYIANRNMEINGEKYFMLTNVCQSCYLLSSDRLNLAITNSNYLKTDYNGLETSHCGIFSIWTHADGIIHKVHTKNLEDLRKCLIHHLPNLHCDPPYKYGRNFHSHVASFDSLTKDLGLT